MEVDGSKVSDRNEEKVEENGAKREKKHKKRQKKILTDLKQQIEFYFSEPNLQKDRFLRQKITEHPQGCVEIATIASFNRMTKLCNDVSLVVKAMKMCSSVKVVDDVWVKPSKPLSKPKNVDSMTIYVENLPSGADHDWIKSVFSSCGKVVYVSLPRFRPTQAIKGFAFVEFEKESEAQQALEMFGQKPKAEEGVDDIDGTKRETEMEEATPEKSTKKNKKRKQKRSELENETAKGKAKKLKQKREKDSNNDSLSDRPETCLNSDVFVPSDKDNSSVQKKRKRKSDEDSEDKELGWKMRKRDEVETHSDLDEKEIGRKLPKEHKGNDKKTENEVSDSDGVEQSSGSKRKREGSDLSDQAIAESKRRKVSCESDSGDVVTGEDCSEKKHKRRRRKKEKEKRDLEVPEFKVISKVEWLQLKEEYKALQRAAMKQTKINLKKQRPSGQSEGVEQRTAGVSGDDAMGETLEEAVQSPRLPGKLEMQRGVVLKYSCEDVVQKRDLRNMFAAIAPVSYLEKNEDKEMGFVRFVTKEGCERVVEAVKNGSLQNIKIEMLTEAEDVEYWERLNNERIERYQQKKRKKQRGTQKITNKLEAQAKKREHIHFDE